MRRLITFSGPPVSMRGAPLGLELLQPEQVGEQVCQAILDNRFLLLTHPEVHDVIVDRARDPEGFLSNQIATLSEESG
jgi:hypothetical protein